MNRKHWLILELLVWHMAAPLMYEMQLFWLDAFSSSTIAACWDHAHCLSAIEANELAMEFRDYIAFLTNLKHPGEVSYILTHNPLN